MHAPSGLGAILRACDDLLTGIAAFLKTHTTDHFEIDHLRYKLFLRRGRYPGNTIDHIEPFPARRTNRFERRNERRPDVPEFTCRNHDQIAPTGKSDCAV